MDTNNSSSDTTLETRINGASNAQQITSNILTNDKCSENIITSSINNHHISHNIDNKNNISNELNNLRITTAPNNESLNGNSNERVQDELLSRPKLTEDYAEIGMIDEEGDYSTPAVRNYELNRSEITLKNTIGVGQFGDVYIGIYQTSGQYGGSISNMSGIHSLSDEKSNSNTEGQNVVMQVAVKTCKTNDDPKKMERFLEEACML